jgi:hypothetical protein
MKRIIFSLTILTGLVAIAFTACNNDATKEENVVISQDSLVKRGSYLVNAIGCDDCHTPKKMLAQGFELDMEHRFGGHLATVPIGKPDVSVFKNGWMLFGMDLTAGVGPWGISYAANISSDATGIGSWTEAQFMKALREGKSKGLDDGRPLLPPMPWRSFAQLSDTDIKAIYAFLKSTKPVSNVVPGPQSLADLTK